MRGTSTCSFQMPTLLADHFELGYDSWPMEGTQIPPHLQQLKPPEGGHSVGDSLGVVL